jgi:hypothetical protein
MEFKKRKMERKKYDLSRTQLRLGEEQIVVRLELLQLEQDFEGGICWMPQQLLRGLSTIERQMDIGKSTVVF